MNTKSWGHHHMNMIENLEHLCSKKRPFCLISSDIQELFPFVYTIKSVIV